MISSSLIVKAVEENIKDSKDVESDVLSLFSYLEENHLLHLLPNILRKLENESLQEEKRITIEIKTSHEFSEKMIDRIKEYMEKGRGEKWNVSVDESLIGGFVIKGHNKILDASLSRNLQFLKETLTQ